MNKRKFITSFGAIIVSGSVLFLQGCNKKEQAFFTDIASYSALANEIEVTGVVHGERDITYYADVTAPVAVFDLKVGDTVNAGQLMVTYDTWDLENSLANAVLNVESVQTSTDGQVKASNKNASIYNKATQDVEIYKYLYAWARNESNGIDIDQYEENWDVAQVQKCMEASVLDKQQKINDKNFELRQKTYGSQEYKDLEKEIKDLEGSIYGIKKDIANLPQMQKNPEEYKKYLADSNWMADIKTNWTQAQTQANTYEGQILNSSQKDALQKNVEIAQLNENIAAENLARAAAGVSADMNGIVTEVMAERGAVVTKGTPLLTIESSDDVKVDVEISKYDIGKISEGQRATIDISGESYEGTVTKINRFATGGTADNAKITVSVKINNPNEKAYLGIQADVVIFTEETQSALSIPREAYYSDDSGEYVYVIADGLVDKKYIKSGIISDEYVEIKDGLSEGAVVIVDAINDDDIGNRAISK